MGEHAKGRGNRGTSHALVMEVVAGVEKGKEPEVQSCASSMDPRIQSASGTGT